MEGNRIYKKPGRPGYTVENARELRENATMAEEALWTQLRNRRLEGWKFRRQAPWGRYILDFYCREARLVVEIDGSIHCAQQEYDSNRDEELASVGITVLRFSNTKVLTQMSEVKEALSNHLPTRPPETPLSRDRERGRG